MGALKRRVGAIILAAAIMLAIGVPRPAQASEIVRWRGSIAEASQRFGVPEAWIIAVIDAESGGRTHLRGRPITSAKGAMGLMQLMPATWAETRDALGLGHDPHDPRDNILAGTFYLRRMYDRFGYPGLFAAYHAGPARYAAYLAGRARLPRETRAYLVRVTGVPPVNARRPTAGQRVIPSTGGGIFFVLDQPGRSELFVIRHGAEPTPQRPE